MKTYSFVLRLSQSELMKYYSGTARNVMVKDITGFTLQIPAEILRPFVSREGVHGRFVLQVDDNGKFIDIRQESPQ